MTERKPPGVSFESFVDKQIREAAERGEFKRLAGFGRPLDDDRAPYDELWWIKGKIHSEGGSVLPPSLTLRKEAEDAVEAAGRAVSESQVRRILDEINKKIAEALKRPPSGPPLNLKPFDVDAMVEEWRKGREDRTRRDG
ncbi:DnaJ family domain-containing protein [Streptomyces sp. NPDC008121]|uniref:DnaJ family domain-containing protein n=1 Tax=Streptomyces sp. NPDC008121 TaxID=3364809 RepID=UPI0036E6AAA1